MKSSCITHPEREPLIVVRKWQIEFCEGDKCAAALMSFFEYWHNHRLDAQGKAEQANAAAEKHGDEGRQDTTLWQFHTETQLEEGILLYSRVTIAKAIALLQTKGVIEVGRNPNPRYAFDNTRHFLFHPEVPQRFLDSRPAKTVGSSQNSVGRRNKSVARSDKSGGTVTEITTEITNRDPSLPHPTAPGGSAGEEVEKPKEPVHPKPLPGDEIKRPQTPLPSQPPFPEQPHIAGAARAALPETLFDRKLRLNESPAGAALHTCMGSALNLLSIDDAERWATLYTPEEVRGAFEQAKRDGRLNRLKLFKLILDGQVPLDHRLVQRTQAARQKEASERAAQLEPGTVVIKQNGERGVVLAREGVMVFLEGDRAAYPADSLRLASAMRGSSALGPRAA
jgi:hypothetical protein